MRDAKGKWLKGSSGNPLGAPESELSLVRQIRLLARQPSREKPSFTRLQAIADKLLEMAEGGCVEAVRLVMERLDGKVREQVDVTLQRGPLLVSSPLFPATPEEDPADKSIETPVAHAQLADPPQAARQVGGASGEVSNGL